MGRSKQKGKKGRFFIIAGTLLIACSLVLTGFNFLDALRAQKSAGDAAKQLDEALTGISPGQIPDYILDPYMEMPVKNIDGQDYIGTLVIPSLELELPVISRWSYPGLRIAPCRYDGSAYTDDMIIAAHNYASHFGRIKNLKAGDPAVFTDMNGNEFYYEVVDVEYLQPYATDEMADGDWDLTLFTCTVGGRNRVTVRLERAA